MPDLITETSRLRLREAAQADAPFFYDLLNAPNWKEYIGDRGIRSLQHATHYIQHNLIRQYDLVGYGLWVVELRDSGQPIGICGLVKRAGLDVADIGFAFLPEHEGQGFAFEAAQATLGYAMDKLGMDRVLAITTSANERSIGLLHRIGLQFQKMIKLPGELEELMLFEIRR